MNHDLPECYLCHMNPYLMVKDTFDELCDQLWCDVKYDGINTEVRGMVR